MSSEPKKHIPGYAGHIPRNKGQKVEFKKNLPPHPDIPGTNKNPKKIKDTLVMYSP